MRTFLVCKKLLYPAIHSNYASIMWKLSCSWNKNQKRVGSIGYNKVIAWLSSTSEYCRSSALVSFDLWLFVFWEHKLVFLSHIVTVDRKCFMYGMIKHRWTVCWPVILLHQGQNPKRSQKTFASSVIVWIGYPAVNTFKTLKQ